MEWTPRWSTFTVEIFGVNLFSLIIGFSHWLVYFLKFVKNIVLLHWSSFFVGTSQWALNYQSVHFMLLWGFPVPGPSFISCLHGSEKRSAQSKKTYFNFSTFSWSTICGSFPISYFCLLFHLVFVKYIFPTASPLSVELIRELFPSLVWFMKRNVFWFPRSDYLMQCQSNIYSMNSPTNALESILTSYPIQGTLLCQFHLYFLRRSPWREINPP